MNIKSLKNLRSNFTSNLTIFFCVSIALSYAVPFSVYSQNTFNQTKGTKALPSISLSTSNLDFENVFAGFYSVPQIYSVTASDLSGVLTITAPAGIEISTNCSTGFTTSINLSPSGGAVSATIWVRYIGGNVSGDITHESAGAVTKTIAILESESFTNLPTDYYSTATGAGATLKTNLYNIISDYTIIDYDELHVAYASTDITTDGYIWDIYSDNPCGADTYNFTLSVDQCGNYSGEGDCYNREHTFPNSWFGGGAGAGAYSDLHQVLPTDGYVNGIRSNYVYGEVSSASYTSDNGCKRGPNTYSPLYTGVVFEPIDEYKGDIARIYFYMITRYETQLPSWESLTAYGDVVMDGNTYPGFESWYLQMLMDWHTQDPVSQKEKNRNDATYLIQGNRNPFVDNPEYVSMIWTAAPTLSVNPAAINSLAYVYENGPSNAQTFSLSGNYLSGFPDDIIVSAPTNFEVSADGTNFSGSCTIPYSAATLNATTVYVRLVSALEPGSYTGTITISGGGDSDGESITLNGFVNSVSVSDCLNEDFSGITGFSHATPGSTDISASINSYTQTTGWSGSKIFEAGGEIKLGSSSANGYIITPAVDLSQGGSVSFDYSKYGSDVAFVQVFHAADGVTFEQVGSDITPETAFLTHSVEITGGTVVSKIKIGTNTKRAYIDNIAVQCGGSAAEGFLFVTPSELNGLVYTEGFGPSSEQNFVVSGTSLDGSDVTITAPTNYEISLTSGTGFQSTPIVLSAFDGSSETIYVRLKAGLGFGIYNLEFVTASGGGADAVTVSLNGEVFEEIVPELVVNPTELNGFNYVEGSGPSAEQSFIISGTNLNETDVTITAPTNYEISLASGTGFQSTPIILSAFDGSSETIYVRLKANLEFGIYNLELATASGGGADAVTVSLNGEVFEEIVPELVVNPTELNGFNYVEGSGPSAEQSFIISGTNLNETDVTITAPTNYEISLASGTGFQSTPIILSAFDGSSETIYVRLKAGLGFGIYNLEFATASGGGAAEIVVTCNGFVDPFVGICKEFTNSNIQVYPNPANDFLSIIISEPYSDEIKIEISDIAGKIVYTSTIDAKSENNLEQINLSSIKPGAYLIRLSNKDNTITRKIDIK
ncbi:MAG: endonuclease [Bacteroidales bacterium]|nr:endonuclease [Bacteroidales bacterium]